MRPVMQVGERREYCSPLELQSMQMQMQLTHYKHGRINWRTKDKFFRSLASSDTVLVAIDAVKLEGCNAVMLEGCNAAGWDRRSV
jgi:hypothetical protein